MSNEKPSNSILSRNTQARMKPTKVRFNELVLDPARFCHRLETKPDENLARSLATEGQNTPFKFFIDEGGNKTLVGGNLRHGGIGVNIERNLPGFTADMEVDAIQILNATEEDLLIISLTDNLRKEFNQVERILISGKLWSDGVPDERAATALGVNVKTYKRDLALAKEGWLVEYIKEDCIAATTAYALVEEAEKAGRVPDLKEYLETVIDQRKREIDEKEKERLKKTGKGLRPGERLVKNTFTREEIAHLKQQLRTNQPLDQEATWMFQAGVDAEEGKLHISAIKLDLARAPVQQIADVVTTLSQAVKDSLPFLETRARLEGPEGPQARLLRSRSARDLSLLRGIGLGDLATQFEQASNASGEDAFGSSVAPE